MCGIAGIISLNGAELAADRILAMTNALVHRGPDGSGHWFNKESTVAFGHRRLAIIDLSATGAQPMQLLPGVAPGTSNLASRYTITYNGEIYNYIELRAELRHLGYCFHSPSDTEVILAAYHHWKQDCLLHFDGMFAFAIWDNMEQELFAARDRFGEKPFYYYQDQTALLFASEMKALWASGVYKEADDKMLLNYLALGHVQNARNKSQTFFRDIVSLPPAHFLRINMSGRRAVTHCYWDISRNEDSTLKAPDAIERFTALFTRAVSRRLRSDVKLGTSLSGGLDSSSIAAAIHSLDRSGPALETFSAVFPGFEKDESAYIGSITQSLNLRNFQTRPTAIGLAADFETVCYHQEEPFGSASIYAQFKVFELARQHGVKVLLDGQGADETMAGYNHHIHWYLQQLLGTHQFRSATNEKAALRRNQVPFRWGIKNYVAAFFPRQAAIRLQKNEYEKAIGHTDLNPEFLFSLRGREWEGIFKPVISSLNEILYHNTFTMGLEELLRFADRNSMAHGTEVRLPFLSHELVEFLFTLPASFKIHEGWTKWLLRHSMQSRLPAAIVWRTDKIGYEPPQQAWMQDKNMQELVFEARRKLVANSVLKSSALQRKIVPLPAHDKDNFDWRYLCAASIL
jgi:asparagine synthase (glutamine-hydrolysing)